MLRALRHRNFQLFFSGQLISLVGTWMDNIAEAWLVYRLTGSSLLLGTVAFAGQIPVFLTGSDRRNGGGPVEPAPGGNCDAGDFDGARGNSCGADVEPPR